MILAADHGEVVFGIPYVDDCLLNRVGEDDEPTSCLAWGVLGIADKRLARACRRRAGRVARRARCEGACEGARNTWALYGFAHWTVGVQW